MATMLILETVVKVRWKNFLPKLRSDERASDPEVLVGNADEYVIRAWRFKVDRHDVPIPLSMNTARVIIPTSSLGRATSDHAVVDIVEDKLVELVHKLFPLAHRPRPPKGWRLFSRSR